MIRLTLIFALLACSISPAFAGSFAATSAGTSAARYVGLVQDHVPRRQGGAASPR